MRSLFDEVKIGNLTLRNRFMFPPVTTGYEVNGVITKKSIDFYRGIAKGGAALIILGDVAPVKTLSPTPMLDSDDKISSFKALTSAVHSEGALIGAQIFHPEYNPLEIFELFMKKDMGTLREKLHHDMEHFVNEVTIDELSNIKLAMINCAIRADKAGFDLIQVHGDRLVGALSSPLLNKRNDIYGGTIENRARFAIEIVEGIREVLPHIAIDYKLAMIKTNPFIGKGGPTIEEGKWVATELVKAGVNSIHACQANHSSVSVTIPAAATAPFMCFSEFSEAIKEVVDIPVSAVGRIVKPEHARELLKDNKADIIAIGRAMIADNNWVNKVKNNKEDSIRFCIMCNKGCTDKLIGRSQVGCAINGQNGIDFDILDSPEKQKDIMIIGAGPAGLECARVATSRGHNVHIYEASDRLGGQLNIATAPEHKSEMKNIVDYLISQTKSVNVTLNKKVTIEDIICEKADEIVLATGATPKAAQFLKGHKNVISAWDALKGIKVGQNVVIVGGGSVGVETAGFIYQEDKNITIIEATNNVLVGESSSLKQFLLDDLELRGIKVLKNISINAVNEDSIVVVKDSQEQIISCDTLVYAVGAKSNNALIDQMEKHNLSYHVIGDVKQPRLLENAIREAYEVAVKL